MDMVAVGLLYHHVMILFTFVCNVNQHLFVQAVGNNDNVVDNYNGDDAAGPRTIDDIVVLVAIRKSYGHMRSKDCLLDNTDSELLV